MFLLCYCVILQLKHISAHDAQHSGSRRKICLSLVFQEDNVVTKKQGHFEIYTSLDIHAILSKPILRHI